MAQPGTPRSLSVSSDAGAAAAAAALEPAAVCLQRSADLGLPVDVQLQQSLGQPAADVEVELVRAQREEPISFGTIGAGGAVDAPGIPRDIKEQMNELYCRIHDRYMPSLQEKYPGEEIEYRGINLSYFEVCCKHDGVLGSIEINPDEDQDARLLRELILKYSTIQRWEVPIYQRGDIAPAGAKPSLSQRDYRIQEHFLSSQFDKMQDFLAQFGVQGEDQGIFEGLSDKQCYQLRHRLHMRDVLHTGLGIQLERAIHRFSAEMGEDLDPAHRRKVRITIEKLRAFQKKLNESNRAVTLLAIAHRFRVQALIEQRREQLIEEAEERGEELDKTALQEQSEEIARQERDALREKIEEFLASQPGVAKDEEGLFPKINEKSLTSQIGQSMSKEMLASAMGYPFRKDALTEEEKQLALDVSSMIQVGESARRDRREYYLSHQQEVRAKSFEEILFVDPLSELEEKIALLDKHTREAEDPELAPAELDLSCHSIALERLFDMMLEGTTSLPDANKSVSEQLRKYFMKDLLRGVVGECYGLDTSFDGLPDHIDLPAAEEEREDIPITKEWLVRWAKASDEDFVEYHLRGKLLYGVEELDEEEFYQVTAVQDAARGLVTGRLLENGLPDLYYMRRYRPERI